MSILSSASGGNCTVQVSLDMSVCSDRCHVGRYCDRYAYSSVLVSQVIAQAG